MKKLMTLTLIALTCCFLSGCGTWDKARHEANAAAQIAHQQQARTFQPLAVTFQDGIGQNGGTVTFTGIKTFTVTAPLEKLPAPKQDRGELGEIVDGAVKLAPFGLGAYLGGKALDNQGDTTIHNEAPAATATP